MVGNYIYFISLPFDIQTTFGNRFEYHGSPCRVIYKRLGVCTTRFGVSNSYKNNCTNIHYIKYLNLITAETSTSPRWTHKSQKPRSQICYWRSTCIYWCTLWSRVWDLLSTDLWYTLSISNLNPRSKWRDATYFSVLTILRVKWQNRAVIGQK